MCWCMRPRMTGRPGFTHRRNDRRRVFSLQRIFDVSDDQTLRLDADVLDAYRRSGPGWQAMINWVLREHMPDIGT